MNQVQDFNNEMFGKVRVSMLNGEPWFIAADVCKALEIGNPTMALDRLDGDEKALISIEGLSRGNNKGNVVSEAGLYSLILGSRKKEAKEFKRWITHEILPTIRKTGGYVANEAMFIETYLPHADEATKALFSSTLQVIQNRTKCSRPSVPLSNSQRLFRRAKITFLWGRWLSLFALAEPRLARNGSSSSYATRRF